MEDLILGVILQYMVSVAVLAVGKGLICSKL